MNQKQAKRIRRELRDTGIDPKEVVYKPTTYHTAADTTLGTVKIVYVDNPHVLARGGRKLYKELKKGYRG